MESFTIKQLANKHSIELNVLVKKFESHGLTVVENGRRKLTPKGIQAGGSVKSGLNHDTGEQFEFLVWSSAIYSIDGLFPVQPTPVEFGEDEGEAQSEGEEYIAEYFDRIDVNYRSQTDVNAGKRLQGDHKTFRRADFYLPDYGIYVEFAGLWNRSDEHRKSYAMKKQVYAANAIPCLWLYPDNLGVINYFFHKRLEQVLSTHKLERKLRNYRLRELWRNCNGNVVGILVGGFFIYAAIPIETITDSTFLFGCVIVIYNIYKPLKHAWNIYLGRGVEISRMNVWEDQ